LWAAMASVFVAADLFNIYVGLEVMTLAAVALVALAGQREALAASIRYLLAGILGALMYLLGVVLLYSNYGVMDIGMLAEGFAPDAATTAAIALITGGLLLKTAVVPLHFWLPAAHAGAPAPVSAVLSGLVVKVSFYVLLRLWLGPFGAAAPSGFQALGVLGIVAVLWGSVQAMRQQRLKMLVAYSTLAQVGYLLLLFPLVAATAASGGGAGHLTAATVWAGGLIHLSVHALAKSAMFLAAGDVIQIIGHDRLDRMRGTIRAAPVSVLAIAAAGASLIGVPGTGGYSGKTVLAAAALDAGEPVWLAAVLGAGVLTAGYVFVALRAAWGFGGRSEKPRRAILPHLMASVALLLALASIALGQASGFVLRLMTTEGPLAMTGLRAASEVPSVPAAVSWAPVGGAVILAIAILAMERRSHRVAGAAAWLGHIERGFGSWRTAGLLLVALVLVLAWLP
jgi:multicomponent Na+:H+ antiporter subunit D